MNNERKIIIAGGGTGGHVFPAIAIARALQRKEKDIQLLFVGAKGKMEMEKVPEAGYEIVGLSIAGMNRSSFWKNISLPFKILRSLSQARKILNKFKPDLVVGVGGYASFPILYTAQSKKIPTVLQEQNAFAGKTNILLSKKAEKVCVASKNMGRFFPKEKIILTGNPVRDKIVHTDIEKEDALKAFELDKNKKTVFIVGGSQGAQSINEALLTHLKEIVKEDIQLIWQTGSPSYEKVKEGTKEYSAFIKPFEFLREIEKAYAAADVIVSRAGAIAVAELCVVGKPVIFVPLPTAAEDHQVKNAESLVREDAAVMIKDEKAKDFLVGELLSLLKDKESRNRLGKNIHQKAIFDADDRIVKEIFDLL